MAHPLIRDAIVWFTPTSPAQIQPYAQWSVSQKAALQQAFARAWQQQPSGMEMVPPNLAPDKPDDFPATIMPPEFTWRFYLAHVGQCLALEIGKRLKWSLLEYSPEEVAIILDSRQWLMKDPNLEAYRLIGDTCGGYSVAPPEFILNFLTQIQFLKPISERPYPLPGPIIKQAGSGQRTAILRLFDWCRHNLYHFAGGFTTDAMKEHWQYHGWPPIARVIEGTIKSGYPLMNWTAGCLGTVGFLVGVLRAVNIPVRNVWVSGHSLPYFVHNRLYLTHGDDLYNRFSTGQYKQAPFPYPSSKLLISQTRFTELFGPGVTNAEKNVGRRPRELAIQYLPYGLLYYYCADQAAGLSPSEGSVFESLGYNFSLAELEQLQLWERLEAKITELGGCEANPPAY